MRRAAASSFVLVLLACVGCDQAAKHAAGVLLASGDRVALLGGAVRFELVSNPGAFLSLGAGLPEPLRHALLVGGVPVVLGLLCLGLLWRDRGSRAESVTLGLLAGGGLGNWIDRVLNHGRVTDFVSVGVGPVRTGIFNVADVAILAGVLLLLVRRRVRSSYQRPV